MSSEKYLEILKEHWGYGSFRGIQEDIIRSIGAGRDTLGLMPTGGGKSVTFQVPALAQEGLCLVITPLIALMKDQVQNLKRKGIKALAVYSGMSRADIIRTLENCIFGGYKFLYISPERLDTEIFQTKLRHMKICFITVDESHCISQWGYDFRPAYLKIAAIRRLLPDVPVLALTATATPEVVKDIQQRLEFKEENVFRMSFERKNLAYIVRNTDNKAQELLHILRHTTGSAIVYVRNRRRTRETAEWLNAEGITAEFYHAGLDNVTKDLRQQRWQADESRVMVATNAFGMGIDKPDVRLVVHLDAPDSIEAYFQEAGRAGRDGQKAYAVLLFSGSDRTTLHKRIADTFPEKEYIRKVYESLQYYYAMAMGDGQGCIREFNLEEFCHRFKYFPVQADSALKILTQAGYIEYTDEQENASRLLFLLERDELYKLHNLGEKTEGLIQVCLRSYTGLFTDFAFISEEALATRSGLTRLEVYDTLRHLSRLRIVEYIPRKRTPYIIYTRPRVEAEQLALSAVYDERRQRYVNRIEAMLHYATHATACRSRLLLHYFGEKNEHDCGICDTCQEHRTRRPDMPDTADTSGIDGKALRQTLLQMLSTKALTPPEVIEQSAAPRELLIRLLREMLDQGEIKSVNGRLQKK